eukprot:188809-Amphidinium_carterae.1
MEPSSGMQSSWGLVASMLIVGLLMGFKLRACLNLEVKPARFANSTKRAEKVKAVTSTATQVSIASTLPQSVFIARHRGQRYHTCKSCAGLRAASEVTEYSLCEHCKMRSIH